MNDFDSSLMTALRDEADRATRDMNTVAAADRLEAGLNRIDRDRRHRRWRTILTTTAAAAVVVAIALLAGQNHHTDPEPTGPPSPEVPGMSKTLVLHFESWDPGSANVEVYADGTVIWAKGGQDHFVRMRLTPEGARWLKTKALSTGLFEHDLGLKLALRAGNIEVHRGHRSVNVMWGQNVNDISGTGKGNLVVDASPTQTNELFGLTRFLRKPVSWAVPSSMIVQPTPTPYVPTHLWVSWDRATPDPSRLPSPAREVLTSILEPVIAGRCEVISIAQAQDIVRAMEQVGLTKAEDVTDGISFDMPGKPESPSFLHAHPALPDTSTCD